MMTYEDQCLFIEPDERMTQSEWIALCRNTFRASVSEAFPLRVS